MPIYEYQCTRCQKVFELMQRVSDPAPAQCEECGGSVTKLMSLSSFALKGTGWYTTDYKVKAVGPSKAEAKPKAETKVENKTETK